MEEMPPENGNMKEQLPVRPFVLTLLCLFTFIFFGLISLVFLLALFFSGTISRMIFRYAPEDSLSHASVIFYAVGGFLLHALSFTGVVLIWKLKRKGYILFGISTLLIALYQLFFSSISPLTTAIYVVFIIAFGVFLKRLK
jgi:hypothetical protein